MSHTVRIKEIHSRALEGKEAEYEPFQYLVLQDDFAIETFTVHYFPTPEAAKLAAQACAEELKSNPWVSAFTTHEDTILAGYGTASYLRRAVVSLWNGNGCGFDLGCIRGFDVKHFAIFTDLLDSYRKYGESDTAFMKLADYIRENYDLDNKH